MHFRFDLLPEGLRVCLPATPLVAVTEWTALSTCPAGAGVLIRLRDEGEAEEVHDGQCLVVQWKSVARLTPEELRLLHLPDPAPFSIEIASSGALHHDDFEIHWGFVHQGRRIVGARRIGAWLTVAKQNHVLQDPQFSILEAVDDFDETRSGNLETRMLAWGQIARMLPDDSIVDDHLRKTRIAVASSFEIHPFLNSDNVPDFDPIIGNFETQCDETGEQIREFASVLPAARHEAFAKRFRGLAGVKHRYAVGNGFYVVLTPNLCTALRAVKRAQAGSTIERKRFLQNVSGYIRGALDEAATEDVTVDSVFSDAELSDRVKGVGIWTEKVLPWLQRAGQSWLPPSAIGLQVGNRTLELEGEEVYLLLERVQEALDHGSDSIETDNGITIPADEETVRALTTLVRELQSGSSPSHSSDNEDNRREKEAPQVLQIIDNIEDLGFRSDKSPRTPSLPIEPLNVSSIPLPHQYECLHWLQEHWDSGSSGVLLADDMGLGKTFEALIFLTCIQTHAKAAGFIHRPVLIVAPTGLLRNWLAEQELHLAADGLGKILEVHGPGLKKLRTEHAEAGNELDQEAGLPKLDTEALARADCVLTTYETLRDYQHSFGRIRWRVGVFDESQKFKNPAARLTDAVLAMNIEFTVLLTGTPVENRPADIWSMLDRIEPGRFGTLKEFSKQYEENDGALQGLHTRLTQSGPSVAPALMLRRLKEDHVQGLPKKHVHPIKVMMSQVQADAYTTTVRKGRLGATPMLQTLQKLRRVSLCPYPPTRIDDIEMSARLAETVEILKKIARRGEKALLFVEFLDIQDFLIVALRRLFDLEEDILVINGTVTGRIRKARVDTFQQRPGFDVMILSPRAGGVGLTLTAANHVIHLSRWWNPAVEDQCTDRVYRIGQPKPVHVYLPLAFHPAFKEYSFDLRLNHLMERKRSRNRQVLAPSNFTATNLQDLYRNTLEVIQD